MVVAAPPATAGAALPPVTVVGGPRALDGSGALVFERQAPLSIYHSEQLVSNVALTIENKGTGDLVLEKYSFSVVGSGKEVDANLRAPDLDEDGYVTKRYPSLTVRAGQSELIVIPYSAFPSKASGEFIVRLRFTGYDDLIVKSPARVMSYPMPGNAFRFPARAEDLPEGVYWSVGNGHVSDRFDELATRDPGIPAHHWQIQFFAYDLGHLRWDAQYRKWTKFTKPAEDKIQKAEQEGGPGYRPRNDEYLIWNRPLYAMADGVVLQCRRTVKENPGQGEEAVFGKAHGGNGFLVRHAGGNGAYAHLMNGSVPAGLCPVETRVANEISEGHPGQDALPIVVRAGQFLGRVGNTGASAAPHTHIHLERDAELPGPAVSPVADFPGRVGGLDLGGDFGPPRNSGPRLPSGGLVPMGVPLQFAWYKTRTYDKFTPDYRGEFDWTTVRPGAGAGLGVNTLIKPNPCGWDPPAQGLPAVVRPNVSWECFKNVFDEVTQAGYVPTWIDGSPYEGRHEQSGTKVNMIFRPLKVGWRATIYNSHAEFKTDYDSLLARGYRNVHVDAFVHEGAVRYTAVYHQTPGPQPYTYVDLSLARHKALFVERTKEGYAPTVISVARRRVAGKMASRFTVIYELRSDPGLEVRHDIDWRRLDNELYSRRDDGLFPVYLDSYLVDGTPKFSVIWEPATPNDINHADPLAGPPSELENPLFELENRSQLQAGRLPVAVTEYHHMSAFHLPAVWRRPSQPAVAAEPEPGFFVIACPEGQREGDDFDLQGSLFPARSVSVVQVDFTSPAGALRRVAAAVDAQGNFRATVDAYDQGDWRVQGWIPGRIGQPPISSNPCVVEVDAENDDNDRRRPKNRRDGEGPREEPCPPGTIRIGDVCVTLPEGFLRSR